MANSENKTQVILKIFLRMDKYGRSTSNGDYLSDVSEDLSQIVQWGHEDPNLTVPNYPLFDNSPSFPNFEISSIKESNVAWDPSKVPKTRDERLRALAYSASPHI